MIPLITYHLMKKAIQLYWIKFEILLCKHYTIISIMFYCILTINNNIVECEPPKLENINDLYIKYSTSENFKEYYNLEIINNTPLILNKWEPLSMTYRRTAMYILESIDCTLEDTSSHVANIADQFYNNMLVFDTAVINNIILNIARINTEVNSMFLHQIIENYLYIDRDNEILTPFTRRDVNLINEGYKPVTSLDTNIKFKKIDFTIPWWKLEESASMTENVDLLIWDIQRRVGLYQNLYGCHDLPKFTLNKIISDIVTKDATNQNFWHDFNNCSNQVKSYVAD